MYRLVVEWALGWSHLSPRGLLGAVRRRHQHQWACDVDLYRSNWRGAEFLQQGCRIWMEIWGWAMGLMGSISVNRQVRSFLKYSYIPPYNNSPFFHFFCSNFSLLISFLPHTCSLSLVNFSHPPSFTASPLLHFYGWTETQATAPLLRPATISSTDVISRFSLVQSSTTALSVVSFANQLPTWTPVYARSYSHWRPPYHYRRRLFLPHFFSPFHRLLPLSFANPSYRHFLFNKPNQRNPLQQSLLAPVSSRIVGIDALASHLFSLSSSQGRCPKEIVSTNYYHSPHRSRFLPLSFPF